MSNIGKKTINMKCANMTRYKIDLDTDNEKYHASLVSLSRSSRRVCTCMHELTQFNKSDTH